MCDVLLSGLKELFLGKQKVSLLSSVLISWVFLERSTTPFQSSLYIPIQNISSDF